MINETLYITENFFSSGITEIFNETKEKVGELDLKSAFSSNIEVLSNEGEILISGRFPFFSNKWIISDSTQNDIGELKMKFSFLSKKYQYNAFDRGTYLIESEAFSRNYDIYDESSSLAGTFERIDGFLSSPAFKLTNLSTKLTSYELIAVVMGVSNIQKRNNAAANSSV